MPPNSTRRFRNTSGLNKICPKTLDFLQRANDDENLLKNVITGDKTWVYSYDVETKKQSSHW
jgi:hypothetical protein